MTYLSNLKTDFADEALAGLVAAHPRHVRAVHGGVVRATQSPSGQVAVVVGGGSGHYPAFAGWVGAGFAHGAPVGNIFASPSAVQVREVARAADNGGGVVLGYGNYAGDVLNFGQAAEMLRAEGIDVRVLAVTDDVASAPVGERHRRRGVAGDLPVFKIVSAAAEAGLSLDQVMAVGERANAATRSLGVAFRGCTLPGADHPLFTVPEGRVGIGVGVHGEPGIDERDLGSADEIADLLLDGLLPELGRAGNRVIVLLNGLGATKYEELFVVYRRVAERLGAAELEVVDTAVGELVTSLDMAGISLTVTVVDAELEAYWTAACNTPAFSRGCLPERALRTDDLARTAEREVAPGGAGSRASASHVLQGLSAARDVVTAQEERLGELDAVAGDGDHGIGMARGVNAAAEAAQLAFEAGGGVKSVLLAAGEAWSERAGGTSGALWGAMLIAAGRELGNESAVDGPAVVRSVSEAVDAVIRLGGAQVGDKTMVDAAVPFAGTLAEQADELLHVAWGTAAQEASNAAERTADIRARVGRARTHGDKSLGTPDPGAVSFALIVTAIDRALSATGGPGV